MPGLYGKQNSSKLHSRQFRQFPTIPSHRSNRQTSWFQQLVSQPRCVIWTSGLPGPQYPRPLGCVWYGCCSVTSLPTPYSKSNVHNYTDVNTSIGEQAYYDSTTTTEQAGFELHTCSADNVQAILQDFFETKLECQTPRINPWRAFHTSNAILLLYLHHTGIMHRTATHSGMERSLWATIQESNPIRPPPQCWLYSLASVSSTGVAPLSQNCSQNGGTGADDRLWPAVWSLYTWRGSPDRLDTESLWCGPQKSSPGRDTDRVNVLQMTLRRGGGGYCNGYW